MRAAYASVSRMHIENTNLCHGSQVFDIERMRYISWKLIAFWLTSARAQSRCDFFAVVQMICCIEVDVENEYVLSMSRALLCIHIGL